MNWEQVDRRRASHLVWVRRRFLAALMEQYLQWSRAVSDALIAPELNTGIQAVTQGPIQSAMNDVYARVGGDFAVAYNAHFKRTKALRVKDYAASDYAAYLQAWVASECGIRIAGMTDTTRTLLQGVIAKVLEEGLSIDKAQREIRQRFELLSRMRAERIARTEIVSASNRGAIVSAESTGLTLNKTWLATRDQRTRPDHAEADGQTVGLSESFVVGGNAMNQPGDPSAPAAEVINCRCTLTFTEV